MEDRVASKLAALEDDPEGATAYLLEALPFIRDYSMPERRSEAESAAAPPRRGALAKLVARPAHALAEERRRAVLRDYMVALEGAEPPPPAAPTRRPAQREFVCEACGGDMERDCAQSACVCSRCGVVAPYLDNAAQNFTYAQLQEQMAPSGSFAYEPMNHFTEFLKQLQAKQDTEIPEHVLTLVATELRMARRKTQSEITADGVREILKNHGLTNMFDHRFKICQMLGGMPAPQFPEALEARLKQRFKLVQDPWRKHKPPERKNFLSYNYTLYKFCELEDKLGGHDFLKYFTLLKCPDKLHKQDQMWEKICKELGAGTSELCWDYIRTI